MGTHRSMRFSSSVQLLGNQRHGQAGAHLQRAPLHPGWPKRSAGATTPRLLNPAWQPCECLRKSRSQSHHIFTTFSSDTISSQQNTIFCHISLSLQGRTCLFLCQMSQVFPSTRNFMCPEMSPKQPGTRHLFPLMIRLHWGTWDLFGCQRSQVRGVKRHLLSQAHPDRNNPLCF